MEAEVKTESRSSILASLDELKAVAVIRMNDPDRLLKVVEAISEGGVRAIEITLTVPGALDLITRVAREMGNRVLIGVGSVLTTDAARDAINAGARYVVSPIFRPGIIQVAHEMDVPAMPGCFTPTEIQTAHEAGADVIKVFPADVLGMAFFKAVLAPMPHLRLMPTGGVTLENACDWLKAGAVAVGVGSALLDSSAIAAGDYARLTENARELRASIANREWDRRRQAAG